MKGKSTRPGIFGNFSLKIISLAVGVILCAYVSSETMMQGKIRVPVEVRNMPQSLVVTGGVPETLGITMSGPRLGFLLVSLRKVHYQLDMSAIGPGVHAHEIAPDELELPWNLKVMSIEPTEMKIEVDRLIRKELPVKPGTTGTVKEGWYVRETRVHPESVTVSIPAAVAARIDGIETEPIDISGEDGKVEREVVLRLDEAGVRKSSADRAMVEITIEIRTVKKRIENITAGILNAPDGARLIPSKVALEIEGPEVIVEKIPLAEISVSVDAAGLPKGRNTKAPEVKLPDGVTLKNCVPETLTVIIP
jgi:YbbR domain-containing protein